MSPFARTGIVAASVVLGALGITSAFWSDAGEQSDAGFRVRRVVIDPGHGGADHGARGASGVLEKTIALKMSRRIGAELERNGIEVLYTRSQDEFISLAGRTQLANDSRADLFISVHANASKDKGARGPETYFVSLDASDDEARRVALVENQVFDREDVADDSNDLVASILGDLIRTDHLRTSSELARGIQRQLDALPGRSRGVKQAPFVVLMRVNMPAVLLEIGFITNREEEVLLRSGKRQAAIARSVARAVDELRIAAESGEASIR